jgi:hypothetical protein
MYFICGLDPEFMYSFLQATGDAVLASANPMVCLCFGAVTCTFVWSHM